jgi:hypothetical protein
MRAKFDEKVQKTRAVLTGTDRRALGRAIEVLVNLQVCEKVNEVLAGLAKEAAGSLGSLLGKYPVECDETKAKGLADEK